VGPPCSLGGDEVFRCLFLLNKGTLLRRLNFAGATRVINDDRGTCCSSQRRRSRVPKTFTAIMIKGFVVKEFVGKEFVGKKVSNKLS
jgi:hypothetical protein